jgi:hypothetical protein
MSCELLGLEWGEESKAYPRVSEVVQSELNDLEFGFRDLGRFKKALTTADEVQEQQVRRNNFSPMLTSRDDFARQRASLRQGGGTEAWQD